MKEFRGERTESTQGSATIPPGWEAAQPRVPRHEDNPKYPGPVPGPMRGPYSDYAPPPIYVTKDRSGPRPGVRFSRTELFQLLVAILALSAALTLANVSASRGLFSAGQLGLDEISHKIVAQRFGLWAEFRYSLRGLAMAFVFAFFGFLIGAPGATMVAGYVTPDQNGKISAAGPGSNLVIGTVFMLAAAAIVRTASVTNIVPFLTTTIFVFAWYMNVILAGFNMIPILPFDGAKVWVWNKGVYVGIVVLVVVLYLAGVYLGITAL